MQNLRDLSNALVIALVSIGVVAGSLSISSVDFVPQSTPTTVNQQLPSPVPLTATSTIPPTATLDVSQATATASIIPSSTITSTPPANCQIPSGWIQITVQVGETLASISTKYRISSGQLQSANCLPTSNLITGAKIYVPPVPPNTTVACVQGKAGWTKSYTVKAGDNLYRIGYDHYTTLDDMRKVNCRVGDTIYVGDVLWVPNIASRTPLPSPLSGTTITAYPTELPFTGTPLPYTATIMPISTLPLTSTIIPTVTVSTTTQP